MFRAVGPFLARTCFVLGVLSVVGFLVGFVGFGLSEGIPGMWGYPRDFEPWGWIADLTTLVARVDLPLSIVVVIWLDRERGAFGLICSGLTCWLTSIAPMIVS